MKCVVQRVSSASVAVDGQVVGSIGTGLLVLAGLEATDTASDVEAAANKIVSLRLFRTSDEKPIDAPLPADGAILAISQFTLAGSVRKGRRPAFNDALAPEPARALFQAFVDALRARGPRVETGRFGATMQVSLVNDGPVTLLVFTRDGAVL